MKKTISIVVLCAVLFAISQPQAQESAFEKGDNIVQGGFGLFMGGGGPVGFVAAYERGVHEFVSVGGEVGFSGFSTTYWSYTEVPIAARAAFHPFNLPVLVDKIKIRDKLDVYGGLITGYSLYFSSWEGGNTIRTSANSGQFLFSLLLGARYYVTPNFGFFVEESAYSFGALSGGVAFKF